MTPQSASRRQAGHLRATEDREPAGSGTQALNTLLHSSCIVCGVNNPKGFGVRFAAQPDGTCTTSFACDASSQGYDGLVHGGVVGALLDGAMANCLLQRGQVAHTGEFSMRFRHPVLVGRAATVRAWVNDARHGVFRMTGELAQDGETCVVASATFVSNGGGKRAKPVRATEV